jgi:hypothetical protein
VLWILSLPFIDEKIKFAFVQVTKPKSAPGLQVCVWVGYEVIATASRAMAEVGHLSSMRYIPKIRKPSGALLHPFIATRPGDS